MAEIKISRLEPFPAENPNGWVVGFTVLIEEKKNFYEVTTVSYDETDNEKEAVDLAYEKLKSSIDKKIEELSDSTSLLGTTNQPN